MNKKGEVPKYKGTLSTIYTVWKEEGARALMRV